MRIDHDISRPMQSTIDRLKTAIDSIPGNADNDTASRPRRAIAIPVTYADTHGCVTCPRCAINMAVRQPQ